MHFIQYARNKEERNFGPQGLQIAAFQQGFSQCGKTLFWRGH